jgi:hypothetical protein
MGAFCRHAKVGVFAVKVCAQVMSVPPQPYRLDVHDAVLADLRERLTRTRADGRRSTDDRCRFPVERQRIPLRGSAHMKALWKRGTAANQATGGGRPEHLLAPYSFATAAATTVSSQAIPVLLNSRGRPISSAGSSLTSSASVMSSF